MKPGKSLKHGASRDLSPRRPARLWVGGVSNLFERPPISKVSRLNARISGNPPEFF